VVTEIGMFESPYLTPLDFSLWGLIKSEIYESKVDTRDEFLSRILDSAVGMQKRED
jgi:hypothetical protein